MAKIDAMRWRGIVFLAACLGIIGLTRDWSNQPGRFSSDSRRLTDDGGYDSGSRSGGTGDAKVTASAPSQVSIDQRNHHGDPEADIRSVEAEYALAANEGLELQELVRRWSDAAERTGHARAREMAFHYEQLSAVDPTGLTRVEALAFELHNRSFSSPNDPAITLLDAGWEALPGLIRFRRDPRPTRTLGDDLFALSLPRPGVLMTIGDACERLLTEILLVVPDGHLAALWRAGPRAHYSSLLVSEHEEIVTAALGKLYSLVPAEYRNLVLGHVHDASDSVRATFLSVAGREFARREPERIESWLATASDELFLLAGYLLWNESDSSAASDELLRRLATAPPAELSDALWTLLTNVDAPSIRPKIVHLLDTGPAKTKIAILERDWPHCGDELDRVVRELLNDLTVSRSSTHDPSRRVCDLAARQLFRRREGKEPQLRWLTPDQRDALVDRERTRAGR